MSQRYQGGFLTASYNGLKVPDAPTIGTATGGDTFASVTFTAPNLVGGGAITGFTVISNPSGITGTGTSSPVTVSGLTNGTPYTFTVVATNAYGSGPASAASNSVSPAPVYQVAYTTAGTYSWVAPSGLNPATVSVVCVGGGGGTAYSGGGGGGLGYVNGYSVTASNSYTVVVGAGGQCLSAGDTATDGGDSYFVSTAVVKGGGGGRGRYINSGSTSTGGVGGTYAGTGGGNGGAGGAGLGYFGGGGSGGAGGYSGTGGAGGSSNPDNAGSSGAGGGGGGGGADGYTGGGGGGGVGLLGSGSNGAGGAIGNHDGPGYCGTGGSNGTPSSSTKNMKGGLYGGGGSVYDTINRPLSAEGAVRIIWSTSGMTRAFPSTNTGDL